MTFGKYFRAQLKRFFRLFPASAAVSLVLVLILGTAGAFIYSDRNSDEQDQIVSIGFTGALDDAYMELALNSLENFDSTRFSVKLVKLDEDEAKSRLQSGDIGAYVVFPENFIQEAIGGNFQKVSIVTLDGAKSFSSRILNELIKSVAEMVVHFQKTVYGYQQAVYDYGYSTDEMYRLGGNVAFRVIDVILERDGMYRLELTEPSGEAETADSIVSGVTAVFIMLWGIVSCAAFSADRTGLSKVLSSKRNGPAKQITAEYAAYLIFMLSEILLIGLAVSAVFALSPLRDAASLNPLTFIPALILPVLMISSMQFFIYEITNSILGGVLVHFILACGMGYICGCFYPPFFFPRSVQQVARWLPAWSARVHINEVVSGSVTLLPCLVLIAYTAVLVLLSVLTRSAKVRAEGGVS